MKNNAKKVLKFMHSERGRKYLMFTSATVAGSIAWGYMSAQTFFIEKYKNVFQLYKNGLVTPVDPDVLSTTKEVIADMKLNAKSTAYVRFFNIFGFDTYHIGSTKTRRGAYIGLPSNFEYKSEADIDRRNIRVGFVPVTWNSDEGRLLEQSLILSKNAQKFAIAKEISHLDTHHIYLHSGIHAMSLIFYTFLAQTANERFYGLYKPASFRITVYSLIGTFVYGLWAVSRDILTKYYENHADQRASALGLNYAKGGVEFYTKIIQRNIAIRGLMGSDGESLYTQFGNDVELIRQRHVPFHERKRNAENAVKEYYARNSERANSTSDVEELSG